MLRDEVKQRQHEKRRMKEKKNIYDENVCLKDGKQYSELVTRGRTAAHKQEKIATKIC